MFFFLSEAQGLHQPGVKLVFSGCSGLKYIFLSVSCIRDEGIPEEQKLFQWLMACQKVSMKVLEGHTVLGNKRIFGQTEQFDSFLFQDQ